MSKEAKKSALDAMRQLEAEREAAIKKAMDEYEAKAEKLKDAAREVFKRRLEEVRKQVDELNEIAAELGITGYVLQRGDNQGRLTKGDMSNRVRRSPEQLKEAATKALDFLKTKGKDGASASDIAQHVGFELKPTPLAFIEKFGSVTVEYAGGKKDRRYFHTK